MIKAETLATVERESHILPKMAFVRQLYTNNSAEQRQCKNVFIYDVTNRLYTFKISK